MKALWLGFSLLVFLSAQLLYAGNAQVKLSSAELSDIQKQISTYGEALGMEAKDNGVALKYSAIAPELLDIGEALYSQGYFSLKNLMDFKGQIGVIADQNVCELTDEPSLCGQNVAKVFTSFHQSNIKNQEPFCVGENGLATAGACCQGLEKRSFINFSAAGSCKKQAQTCTEHTDCCSRSCEKIGDSSVGQCAEALSCYKLKAEGANCSKGSPYCQEGLTCLPMDSSLETLGACQAEKSQCKEDSECCSGDCHMGQCVEKSLCSNCAGLGQRPTSGQKCCEGTYKNKNGLCIQKLAPMSVEFKKNKRPAFVSIFASILNFIMPSAYAESCVVDNMGMTSAQAAEFKSCMDAAVGYGGPKRARESAKCDKIRKDALKANEGLNCSEQKLSDFGEEATREEYRRMHKTAILAEVEKSDVKKCEFNSFKDSWVARSNLARNAEIAIMGFEFVHSGKGEDMITSGQPLEAGKNQYWGKSIFSRAQKVAMQLRENRYKLVDKYKSIDEEMTCKCLAVFGAEKMGKQEFFAKYCGGEAEYVTEEGVRDGENNEVAEKEGEAGDYSTMDKASAGLSLEKLLIEWLGLRRDAQLAYATDTSKLEEELMDLSEFIGNYPWIETPTLERKTHKLHDFTVWWPAGIVRIFTGGGGSGSEVKQLDYWSHFDGMKGRGQINDVTWGTLTGLFNGNKDVEPNVEDPETRGRYCLKRVVGVCLKRAKDYQRNLLYPYFDNANIHQPKKKENRCKLNGLATSCIKSVFTVDHEFKYGELEEIKNHPLLDVPLPITVSANAYPAEELEGGKTYAQALNDAFVNDALPAMKKTDDKYLGGGKIKKRSYHKSMRYYIFRDPVDVKKFALKQGNWTPKKFNDYKGAFLKGAKRYALCKDLSESDCAQHSKELLGSEGKALGFGNIFENESDAMDFANYVYEMHVVFPRMSLGGRIAYPTLGLNAYYASMAHNLRLIGSLALKRSLDSTTQYDLYMADFEKRKGDYKGLGSADQGTASKNVDPTQKAWSALKTLDFDSPASIKAFGAKIQGYEKSGELGGAQLQALKGAYQHAINGERAKANEEEFKKIAGVKGGNPKLAKAISALNSPLENIGLSVGGKNLGAGSGLNQSASTSDKSQNDIKKEKQKLNTYVSDFRDQGVSYSAQPNANYSDSSYDIDDKGGPLTGALSSAEVKAVLEAAGKDESLEASPGDSLWRTVSKAYKRNLSRVLVLRSDLDSKKPSSLGGSEPMEKIKSSEQKELKKLLEENED